MSLVCILFSYKIRPYIYTRYYNALRCTGPVFQKTRYQITFLPEHEIIGEFGQKSISDPLNNSSSDSNNYKKEMQHNVYIKSIHSSIMEYAKSNGMKVGDMIESIHVGEGPDSFEHEVTTLDDTTNSMLNDERPITLTCFRKSYNENYLRYWKWRVRMYTRIEKGRSKYLGSKDEFR